MLTRCQKHLYITPVFYLPVTAWPGAFEHSTCADFDVSICNKKYIITGVTYSVWYPSLKLRHYCQKLRNSTAVLTVFAVNVQICISAFPLRWNQSRSNESHGNDVYATTARNWFARKWSAQYVVLAVLLLLTVYGLSKSQLVSIYYTNQITLLHYSALLNIHVFSSFSTVLHPNPQQLFNQVLLALLKFCLWKNMKVTKWVFFNEEILHGPMSWCQLKFTWKKWLHFGEKGPRSMLTATLIIYCKIRQKIVNCLREILKTASISIHIMCRQGDATLVWRALPDRTSRSMILVSGQKPLGQNPLGQNPLGQKPTRT